MEKNSGALPLFEGDCLSQLYEADISDGRYGFLLSYPSTAAWSPYPNTTRFFIQDGHVAAKKVPFDQIRQKEPWKILAALGRGLQGILTSAPPRLLVQYWRDYLHCSGDAAVLPHETWGDLLNQGTRFDRVITLFPYDRIRPELHAIDPERHYHLLSKISLGQFCPNVPHYRTVDLTRTPLDTVTFPGAYPYAVKTSHGLSGEGTYIINGPADLAHCRREIQTYLAVGTLKEIVVMDFVSHAKGNYCIQFYVDRGGGVRMIGATTQLVTPAGIHLGGVIRYRETDLGRFAGIVRHVAENLCREGYFGVAGIDVLEDRDGTLHVIDANIRVNGSTPLCLQRRILLEAGKETARYTTDLYVDMSLDQFLVTFKSELDRREMTVLSALEYPSSRGVRTEIYGIVAGEEPADLDRVQRGMGRKGLCTVG